jgi:hypothetical protein
MSEGSGGQLAFVQIGAIQGTEHLESSYVIKYVRAAICDWTRFFHAYPFGAFFRLRAAGADARARRSLRSRTNVSGRCTKVLLRLIALRGLPLRTQDLHDHIYMGNTLSFLLSQ